MSTLRWGMHKWRLSFQLVVHSCCTGRRQPWQTAHTARTPQKHHHHVKHGAQEAPRLSSAVLLSMLGDAADRACIAYLCDAVARTALPRCRRDAKSAAVFSTTSVTPSSTI